MSDFCSVACRKAVSRLNVLGASGSMGLMPDSEPWCGPGGVSGTSTTDRIFETLILELREMSPSHGGGEALRLSSLLLEFAAFELAAELGSDQAGALIEAAADVSHQAELRLRQVRTADTTALENLH